MDESNDWQSVEQESKHDWQSNHEDNASQNEPIFDEISNETSSNYHPMTEIEKQEFIDIANRLARDNIFSVLLLIQQFTQKFPNRSIIQVYQFAKSMVKNGVMEIPHSPTKNRKTPPLTPEPRIVSSRSLGSKRINGPVT